jgi:ABC-type amino acid transport substrate-binding protein
MYLGIFLLIAGNVLWWAERGSGAIRREYFPGILEAFWCVMATMTTVGYGDIAPKRWLGRCMAVLIMLSGIGLFGVLAAALTADLITEHRVSAIENVQSLKGLRVATKQDTSSSEFLTKHGVRVTGVESFPEARELLQIGRVDAVVYDEPVILYSVSSDSSLLPVGPQLKQEYYAFAFPESSRLRERVNRALLKAYNEGEYATIHDRWFRVK